ncbi:hypothetical protein PUNSTDRAFT_48640 [Punctularia strigosozonata HHB-11173 SS5]|uniref:uncharacterized protein n=1 Tax=Punctularia strigosozonata (strain HHB-11173) TaxID=741275 RepID=UPI0004417547|nr:uncharacterized protein PUNSTDRAFT_48640 [Punctularia strigosozonata HHB-11173 SS5]EIN13706.1 hypothetical protein PUNSTDRAFT_48640 [Punctularia strigosozonata HHB-11173 SS5]
MSSSNAFRFTPQFAAGQLNASSSGAGGATKQPPMAMAIKALSDLRPLTLCS